jgi:hypothetical protein
MSRHTITSQGGPVVVMPSLAGDMAILSIEPTGEGMSSLTLSRDALSVLLFALESVADCMDLRQARAAA